MFSIISGILGFATSGLPSLLGFFQQRGDQKHERDMAKLQNLTSHYSKVRLPWFQDFKEFQKILGFQH